MTAAITPLVMPKWGLEMREGTIGAWLVDEGARVSVGQPIVEVETDKISNTVEAADPGLLRRRVAREGETLPVKALLGVLAEADVTDAEVDAYIAAYVVPATDAQDDAQDAYAWTSVDGIRVRHARRGPDPRHAGAVPARLRRRPRQLAVQPRRRGRSGAGHRARPAGPRPVGPAPAGRQPGRDGRLRRTRLDALEVPRAHVVGHSMGGAIAARLALDQPERVASAVLVNSAGLGPEINAAYIEGFLAAQSRRELKPVVEQLFADAGLVNRQLLDDLLRTSAWTACPNCWARWPSACSPAAARRAAGAGANAGARCRSPWYGASTIASSPPSTRSARPPAAACTCCRAPATWR
jgi:pyruvate dehydrogenase E2 component (dihydrolipoamide acetyltransferase)